MAYVAINVLTVPSAEDGATLEARFAARAGMVERAAGFLSFDLLRPVAGTADYLVMTRWQERADYEAWLASRSFQQGHAAAGGGAAGGSDRGQDAPAAGPRQAGSRPASVGSQIWGFEVVQSVAGGSAEG